MMKFLRNKKGIGTMLGTVIFVGVILTLMVTIGYAEVQYQKVVREQHNYDNDRLHEQFEIFDINSTGVTVKNTGVITVHIVAVYINRTIDSQPDVYIAPDKTSFIPTTANPIGEIKVASERGNQAGPVRYYGGAFNPTQTIAYSYLSMKITYRDKSNKWHNDTDPAINLTDLRDAVSNKKMFVSAIFRNTSGKTVYIDAGNILFQISDAYNNNKMYGMGGMLQAAPGAVGPDELMPLVFSITSLVQLDTGKPDGTYWVFMGSAAFSSLPSLHPGDFFSGAILMDGLLVLNDT